MADRSRLLLSLVHLAHELDRLRTVAYCNPSRASRTSVTASGNTTAITWRIC